VLQVHGDKPDPRAFGRQLLDADADPTFETVANPDSAVRDVQLRWHVSLGAGDDRKVREVAAWNSVLPAGAETSVYAKLPYLNGYEQAVESSADQFDPRLAEAAKCWHDLLDRAVRLDTPEQRVNDAYRAWLGYTFTNSVMDC